MISQRTNMKLKMKKIYIIIRNDDLCALSDAGHERRIFEMFERHGVPQTIGVIPKMTNDPHNCELDRFHPLSENPKIVALLEEYQDMGLIEVAQHGVTHQTNAQHPNRSTEITDDHSMPGLGGRWSPFEPVNPLWYSEFNGLPVEEQNQRIVDGAGLLTEIFGQRPQTFIFPWDSANPDALAILEGQGFKQVLCSSIGFIPKKLNVIGYVDGDMFNLPDYIEEMAAQSKPVLTQVAYHSWMLSEEEIARLDDMLATLSAREDICFVTAAQAAEIFPAMKNVLDARTQAAELVEQTNVYLANKTVFPGYYVMDRMHYLTQSLAIRSKLIFVKYIGYRKTCFAFSLAFVAYLIFLMNFSKVQPGMIQIVSLCLLGMVAAVSLKKTIQTLSQEAR